MTATNTNANTLTVVLGDIHGCAVTVDLANSTYTIRSWDDEGGWGGWSLQFTSLEEVEACLVYNLWPSLAEHPEYRAAIGLDQAVGMSTTTPLGSNREGIAFAVVHHPDGRFTVHSWNEDQLCGHWAAGFTHLWEVNEYLHQNSMPPLSGN